MHLTRRQLIRIICYAASVMAIIAGFAVTFYVQSQTYKRYISQSYQRSFAELADYMNNIDYTLQKGLYANSPAQFVNLSSQVWKTSSAAKQSLSQMPFYASDLMSTSKYLSQIGDFVNMLSKKVLNGGTISDEDRATLQKLSDYASTLSTSINALQAEVNEGKIKNNEIINLIKNEQKNNSGGTPTLTNELAKVEQDITDFPKLIYDGPFSEHIETLEPVLLKGKPTISQQDAKAKAAEFLNVNPADLTDGPDNSGLIPTFGFNKGDTHIEVTQTGGVIYTMLDSRPVNAKNIAYPDAVKKAADYLASKGYSNMKESYYFENNNILTINFAYTLNGVTVFTDLIKVGVSLDDGGIISLETKGYIASHTTDRNTKAAITTAEAEKKVSKALTINNSRLTIIPTPGKSEMLCYEFDCKSADNKNVLVYINAKNGNEEDILILLQSDNGTLVM